jgi:serine protease AprX
MDGLDRIDFLPEPTDRRILSAIDPSTSGYHDEWRAEVTGWAPHYAEPIVRIRRKRLIASNVTIFAILSVILLLVWQSGLLFIELSPPKSEWAFEVTEIRQLQEQGLDGQGVRICMVDTGFSPTHSAFDGVEIVFKDMVGDSTEPVDYGTIGHGTMMAGLLISQSHQIGISPNVTLAVVAALSDNGDGVNSGDEAVVADAIRWCHQEFNADIISLSLGGQQKPDSEREGASVSATRMAVDSGIFVVAAAGNDGGGDDDGMVSAPGNVARVITVGATTKGGLIWSNSSIGSQLIETENPRQNPNLKPEIVSPGHMIISTGNDGDWYSSSGTSVSTVFVSGALALILQAHPELKPTESSNGSCIDSVKLALMNSAHQIDLISQHDNHLGYGELRSQLWLQEISTSAQC